MAKRLGMKAGKKKRLAMKRGRHMMPGMEGTMRDEDMPKGMMAQAKRKKRRRKGRKY